MISEKDLYGMGNCTELNCTDCPFYKSSIESQLGAGMIHSCYSAFKKYYEKKELLDYVLKGEDNDK